MTTALTTTIDSTQARVNVTYNGENGDLPDVVFNDSADGDIFSWVTEAVQGGDVPGIPADASADFSDFVVERFAPNDDRPYNYIVVRPKTPFGAAFTDGPRCVNCGGTKRYGEICNDCASSRAYSTMAG